MTEEPRPTQTLRAEAVTLGWEPGRSRPRSRRRRAPGSGARKGRAEVDAGLQPAREDGPSAPGAGVCTQTAPSPQAAPLSLSHFIDEAGHRRVFLLKVTQLAQSGETILARVALRYHQQKVA